LKIYVRVNIDMSEKMNQEMKNDSPSAPVEVDREISLDDKNLFINRELSWLEFNSHVLDEAMGNLHPLLERCKFLAITYSNLDEFFMVRVAGLRRQVEKGALRPPPDGLTPIEQLLKIRERTNILLERTEICWRKELLPGLRSQGIDICRMRDLRDHEKVKLRKYFEDNIFPTLTPLAMDLAHPFPFISNLSLNLAVVIKGKKKGEKYARIKVPTDLFPRFVKIPGSGGGRRKERFILLEDIIALNLDLLFPGMNILSSFPFRITRNAEIEIELDEASDLLTAVEDSIESRRIGRPIRLEVEEEISDNLLELFAKNLEIDQDQVYRMGIPLGLSDMMQLMKLDKPDLKDPPFRPYTPPRFKNNENIFLEIKRKDLLLYHPYDSFEVVTNFIEQAAIDPDVLSIKICLYRVDSGSRIIKALLDARQNGKAVAAIVELKARFDEENNINWARALEREGVHVVYGHTDLKVHAKMCQVVRKEGSGISRYTHISTGNYNALTARIYADLGYLTADKDTGEDVTKLFNYLTGYSSMDNFKRIIVAPKMIRREMISKIQREVKCQKENGNGYIALKMNQIVDKAIIQELYRASIEGVKIDLNVRGLCCLRPGFPGASENIRVNSIVGRFLEHTRIYYFHNDGDSEVIIGSADMMPRNLDRRVEVLYPIEMSKIKKDLINKILKIHLADNTKSWSLDKNGEYAKVQSEETPVNSQDWLIENRGSWCR
jgi:polyphosphate kinase